MPTDKTKQVLTLYVGQCCHLCDQARELIRPLVEESNWQLEEVVITDNEELMSLYGIRIPVVKTANGQEKSWPFTYGQIKRLLQ